MEVEREKKQDEAVKEARNIVYPLYAVVFFFVLVMKFSSSQQERQFKQFEQRGEWKS